MSPGACPSATGLVSFAGLERDPDSTNMPSLGTPPRPLLKVGGLAGHPPASTVYNRLCILGLHSGPPSCPQWGPAAPTPQGRETWIGKPGAHPRPHPGLRRSFQRPCVWGLMPNRQHTDPTIPSQMSPTTEGDRTLPFPTCLSDLHREERAAGRPLPTAGSLSQATQLPLLLASQRGEAGRKAMH